MHAYGHLTPPIALPSSTPWSDADATASVSSPKARPCPELGAAEPQAPCKCAGTSDPARAVPGQWHLAEEDACAASYRRAAQGGGSAQMHSSGGTGCSLSMKRGKRGGKHGQKNVKSPRPHCGVCTASGAHRTCRCFHTPQKENVVVFPPQPDRH